LFEDDGGDDQDACGDDKRDRVALAVRCGCWRCEGRLFGQDRGRGCGLKRVTACWITGITIIIWRVDRVFDENLADQRRWLTV
jgi:hypothetical protein